MQFYLPGTFRTLCFRKWQTVNHRPQQNFSGASTHISSPISRWRLNLGSDRRDHEGVRPDRTTKEWQQMPGPKTCLMSMQSLMGQMKGPRNRSIAERVRTQLLSFRKQQAVFNNHTRVMTDWTSEHKNHVVVHQFNRSYRPTFLQQHRSSAKLGSYFWWKVIFKYSTTIY